MPAVYHKGTLTMVHELAPGQYDYGTRADLDAAPTDYQWSVRLAADVDPTADPPGYDILWFGDSTKKTMFTNRGIGCQSPEPVESPVDMILYPLCA